MSCCACSCRKHSGYELSQWETTLHCNVVFISWAHAQNDPCSWTVVWRYLCRCFFCVTAHLWTCSLFHWINDIHSCRDPTWYVSYISLWRHQSVARLAISLSFFHDSRQFPDQIRPDQWVCGPMKNCCSFIDRPYAGPMTIFQWLIYQTKNFHSYCKLM